MIFSGCVLLFSILKIKREIKKREIRVDTENLLCHASSVVIYTIISLVTSIYLALTEEEINEEHKKAEFSMRITSFFCYQLSQGLLLVILWRLGTNERVVEEPVEHQSEPVDQNGPTVEAHSWDAEASLQARIWQQFVR